MNLHGPENSPCVLRMDELVTKAFSESTLGEEYNGSLDENSLTMCDSVLGKLVQHFKSAKVSDHHYSWVYLGGNT